ncbi:acyltransferase family protein [Jeotgalibacillus soli]|uniref:Acyltransferase n=1 Tax=Jeotgalibacillus soli TaxID=889306 RepID=A0A0C2VN27_9BACL|nr:acyltransferase family protein [Jeotgalibacillus soli]KIL45861.1 acyltransferase [Jeotgalibacillus soli]
MSKRDYYFDNAKFFLIFLVVFGHAIQTYIEYEPFLLSLYKTIYSFHMPAFILVAGYFAKGVYEKGYARVLVKKLILPYLIFQVIYSIYYFYLRNESTLTVDPFHPQWSLWFLVSLFCWNLMLLLFVQIFKLSWKPTLITSIVFGLFIGYFNDVSGYLSLSRTFVFFPFFLLGYYIKREHFHMLNKKPVKLAAYFSLSFVLFLMILLPEWSNRWLLGSHSYQDLGQPYEISPLIRFTIYALNIWLIASFFSIVPQKKYFFTNWGKNTLYVYLLHGFIIQLFRETQIGLIVNPFISLLLIMVASLFLTILLSTNWITAIAQPLIELRANRLKKMLSKHE